MSHNWFTWSHHYVIGQSKASRKIRHCLFQYRRGAADTWLWEAIGWASR